MVKRKLSHVSMPPCTHRKLVHLSEYRKSCMNKLELDLVACFSQTLPRDVTNWVSTHRKERNAFVYRIFPKFCKCRTHGDGLCVAMRLGISILNPHEYFYDALIEFRSFRIHDILAYYHFNNFPRSCLHCKREQNLVIEHSHDIIVHGCRFTDQGMCSKPKGYAGVYRGIVCKRCNFIEARLDKGYAIGIGKHSYDTMVPYLRHVFRQRELIDFQSVIRLDPVALSINKSGVPPLYHTKFNYSKLKHA